MKPSMKSISFFLLTLFCSAFLLNFLWESIHGAFLYQGIGDLPSKAYLPLMLYATVVDAVLITVMWILTSLILRNTSWIDVKKPLPWAIFSIFGLVFALFIEIRALFFQHRWAYSALMPTITGIGVSPLIQLVITGIIAVKISSRLSS